MKFIPGHREKQYSLTNNINATIKDREYLLQNINNINPSGLPNMFPNNDNINGTKTVKLALKKRPSQNQSKIVANMVQKPTFVNSLFTYGK